MSKKLLHIEWPMEVSKELQFLQTSKTSKVLLATVKSSMEDFHVKTSVLPALEKAWQESEVGFFLKSSDSLAKFDLDSFSWKTSQLSLFEDSTELQWNLLRWGMIVDGQLYQPPQLEPITGEKDSSVLPTPTTVDSGSLFNRSASQNAADRPTLGAMAKFDSKSAGGGAEMKRNSPKLSALVKFRTPMNSDHKDRGVRKDGQQIQLQTQVGGQLNPMWVEWLMGLPLGWTELKPLGMESCPCKQEQPLNISGEFN